MKINKSSLFMMDITIVCSDTELAYKKEQQIDIQLGIPRNYRSNVEEKVIQVFGEVCIEGAVSMDVSRYSWNATKAWVQSKMMAKFMVGMLRPCHAFYRCCEYEKKEMKRFVR